METLEKPRVNYADFVAGKKPEFTKGTVAWVIEKFIREMNGLDGQPAVKTLGVSHEYNLRARQKEPIGAVMALELDKSHVIAHCRKRQAAGALPQTVQQDVTYLTVALKYAGSAFDDCKGISDKAIDEAYPFLKTNNLVKKSEPRDILPSQQDIDVLEADFAKSNRHPACTIDMVQFQRWQLASSRRLSESCRANWIDWDFETQTMVVYKMKDSKNRNRTERVALTDEAQDMLIEMAFAMDADPAKWNDRQPRIFPYNAKSVGAKYSRFKKKREMKHVLHDCRAKCYTGMREKGIPAAVAILVTGHKGEQLPERVYKRMKAESFKLLQHMRVGEQRAAA